MKVRSKDGRKVKVIFYESKDSVGVKQPCLLYFHGGAFVYSAIWHHYRCARLYARNGVKVAFVDYRLAPRYKYPVGADDCFAVYEYLVKNADELNVYGDRIALGGDSAGGFYVLSTLKRAEEEKLPPPKALMMIYPVIDSDEDSYSIKTFVTRPSGTPVPTKKCGNIIPTENVRFRLSTGIVTTTWTRCISRPRSTTVCGIEQRNLPSN